MALWPVVVGGYLRELPRRDVLVPSAGGSSAIERAEAARLSERRCVVLLYKLFWRMALQRMCAA